MKQLFSFLLVSVMCVQYTTAQKSERTSVIGMYDQEVLVAPDDYRDSEKDVSISQDTKASKKLWIHDLIPNQKFYAVLNMNSDGRLLYAIPQQTVGDYNIAQGCLIFESGDITISLNNKINCFGMSQKDYDKPVTVSEKGVEAGGVKVGNDGAIEAPGVEVNKNKVSVNTKAVMEGIQYIGHKTGLTKKKENMEDDNDNDM